MDEFIAQINLFRAELARLLDTRVWHPIETAPRDRYILLLESDEPIWAGNMEVGCWYGGDDGCFWSSGGPNGGLELDFDGTRKFTHWMELPQPAPSLTKVEEDLK